MSKVTDVTYLLFSESEDRPYPCFVEAYNSYEYLIEYVTWHVSVARYYHKYAFFVRRLNNITCKILKPNKFERENRFECKVIEVTE